MTILLEVLKELYKMFMADMRLTLATLASVISIWAGLSNGFLGPVASGLILALLCVAVLIEAVLREARLRRK